MKVVARFSFPHEAHIAKASLEAAGIESVIADEHTINAQWLYSDAIGGVRLMVTEPDQQEAIAILATDFSTAVEQGTALSDEIRCPHCGDHHYKPFTKGKRPAFVVFLLLGFPLFYYQHGYQCQSCGEFFKSDDE
ncbi:DUF2007 domain-containing protein [Photobacterium sp. 1_MG-2023]|uniref:putative signal transducing protein n=1 Tax=Photobacterium sp. 1_MG-2023 TaxID=3062646 RepID=UPI0026E3901D|nr:DUF2007 domain-containing protein [Photobacterium sp. 1_MG-2023]MDO6705516.1 DUF2007 domain-containing protein [Photobacterium sp. 1_MG-2023]